MFHYKCPYFPFYLFNSLFPRVETELIFLSDKLKISVGNYCKLHMHILK